MLVGGVIQPLDQGRCRFRITRLNRNFLITSGPVATVGNEEQPAQVSAELLSSGAVQLDPSNTDAIGARTEQN